MGTRTAYEVFDRVGGAHSRGTMGACEVYDWGSPINRPRIECFDHGRQVWVRPDREVQRMLNRLSDAQLAAVLRNMPFGFRQAPEFDDAPDLDAKLNKALKVGLLTFGGRSYKLSGSPTGNIRVRGSFGTLSYTRAALKDVIQRGHF